MTHTASQTALVLGPTGKFGRHVAKAFEDRNWTVRRFRRDVDRLDDAAQGADVIVMGWHPPSYHTWAKELLPMHRKVIAAARKTGATVILPGNVYNYGPEAPRGWHEGTPHLAQNPLARLRIEMEALYRDAGVRTILIRAGDFIDTQASGNWFDMFIAKKAARGVVRYPGDLDTPHAWAYLPDLGRAAALLAERRDQLATYEEVVFPGYTLTGRDLAEAMGKALNRPVRARRLSWLPFYVIRPFMPMMSGLFEMRYLWNLPHHLDGTKLAQLCPEYRDTPVTQALATAVAGLTPAPKVNAQPVTA